MHRPARPQFAEHRVRIINEPGIGQVNGHSWGPSSRTRASIWLLKLTYVVHVCKRVARVENAIGVPASGSWSMMLGRP